MKRALRYAGKWQIASAASAAILMLAVLGFVRWRALEALSSSAREISSEENIRFEVRELPQNSASKFDWISAPAVYSQAAEFAGYLYLCGPAGVYEYAADGTITRQFRTGRELPSSPVTQIAPAVLADAGQPELLIATADEGVIAFNGSRFRQILPEDAQAREITAILPTASGHLLMGTSERGVLVYDGKHIQALHGTLSGVHVTQLAGDESDLWVGTIGRGVLHWHAGQTDSFGEEQGLPDPQVLSLLVTREGVFVGTPLGVAQFKDGRFERVLARGAFAQALGLSGRTLLIGTMDQGVIRQPLEAGLVPAEFAHSSDNFGEIEQIFESGDGVYALARQGLYELGGRGAGRTQLIQPQTAVLTDENISALSLDGKGRLWVGFFERGLDIVGADGRRERHLENERVFCVNRIIPIGKGGDTAVATANGLVLFDAEGNAKQVMTRADGLIADDVTDIAPQPGGMALATPAGITFLGADGARSLYAFQGLVNNHVYALSQSGGTLLAGTLGGISILDKGQIVTNYTTANSSLNRNWISAVVPLVSGWMVGTYGGGIVRLDDAGQFHRYDIATKDFDVNPNAMLATGEHVFAGSLGNGLYVYDRGSDRWSRITEGLPSENVTALAAGKGYLYIGTDNGLVRVREQDLEP